MGLMGCHETSVVNYHYTLRNIPEERRSQIYGDVIICVFIVVLMCVRASLFRWVTGREQCNRYYDVI